MKKFINGFGEFCATMLLVAWLAALLITVITFPIGSSIWSIRWLISLIGG